MISCEVNQVTIIGGGLAGCEAAWQLSRRGIPVSLVEMKPEVFSPAHKTEHLAELVCSNSLRANAVENAVGLLKEEMRIMESLIVEAADATSVPAGRALAVDRSLFSLYVERKLSERNNIRILRREVKEISDDSTVIIATGPLTSVALTEHILTLTGSQYLYFYDAISPIIYGDSIDYGKIFRASRYGEGQGDYVNCPFVREEYECFWNELIKGEEVPLRDFEDRKCFEGCLPVEVIARRGINTLAFGPMKPVGLVDPRTGKQPHAVIQLRQENMEATLFNIVGFQTKLSRPEQRRIFRTIPGLKGAEFARYGSIHRNTFINSPALLDKTLQLRSKRNIFFAGQITGVEGYVESAASGLIAGISAFNHISGKDFSTPPEETALGALIHHITDAKAKHFQPMNINFGLFPPLPVKTNKRERGRRYAERSLNELKRWKDNMDR
ncbi:MAG: methylenetetrahydrofolate--tRNA-(uracil(54)-C(5))-methyltransferase (FADH(2)-oxidizing) TrmFO [Deltaproteobacteria bacterium]|nr:methylenetetrahydrofolate--tRNA-(uracil(54)-C(5))-methyltransferase (FADH(2)-oxidizing) TrmFO [Deltaproteobacteria bacterium]